MLGGGRDPAVCARAAMGHSVGAGGAGSLHSLETEPAVLSRAACSWLAALVPPLENSEMERKTSSALEPSKGGRPVSISCSKMPSAHQSAAQVRPRPLTTSGGAYSSVPHLVKVREAAAFLAKPKSQIFTYPSSVISTFSSLCAIAAGGATRTGEAVRRMHARGVAPETSVRQGAGRTTGVARGARRGRGRT